MRGRDNVGCQWFEQVWNRGEESAMDRLAPRGFVAHGADGLTRNLDEFKAFFRLMREAVPDMHIDTPLWVDGGSMIAVHWVATGTHTGATAQLGPATARAIRVEGLSLIRVDEDGAIVEGWDDYDYPGLLRQLGAAV
jgi:predicted ester cyclase